jgi:hypothetical protein
MSFNGQFVRNASELSELMSRSEVGQKVNLGIRRGSQDLNVEVVFKSRREVYGE